jgi:formate dehydrogenase subunit gamma
VPIDGGFSGKTVERFNGLDRFAHWLSATSFIILAVTGLNIVYGKYFILPIVGPAAFSWITQAGKYAHNFVAFAFMAGVVLMFLLWVRFNIPKKHDLTWLAKGGGIFNSKVHPPSERFNAGQKVIFWLACLGGLSLSMSGIALLFPYEFGFFAKTFGTLNAIGFNLPTEISPLQEQQLNQIWHSILAFVLIAIMMAHIYIGSVGMQGAFAAMGSGQVDVNWAEEHHNMWYERLVREGKAPASSNMHPAE